MSIRVVGEIDLEFPKENTDSGERFQIPLGVFEELFDRYPEADIIIPLGKNIGHHFPVYYKERLQGMQTVFDVTDEVEEDLIRIEFQLISKQPL